jgi:hypothetical protein
VQRKPREGETADQVAAALENQAEEEDGAFLDIGVEIINVIEDEDGVEHRVPVNQERVGNQEQGQNVMAQGVADPGQAPAADGAAPVAQGQGRVRAQGEWEFRQNLSTSQIASTVLGALFFPAISSLMGDLLKLSLPTYLVTQPAMKGWGLASSRHGPTTGLLQMKWGRSLIGGCLFIVLRDMVGVYVRWKKARDFGKRKVMDFRGKRRTG